MSASRAETERRLDRLTGAGEGSGGGLPLPDLFSAFLVELLDNGPATAERLVAIAEDKLEYKASRVIEGWGSWVKLTDDVLRQMASKKIVRESDGTWHLNRDGKFTTGTRLEVIPKRPGKNRNSIGITVYPREEREERDQAADARMQLTEFVGLLDRGLRRVKPGRVEEIRQSIAEFGDHRNVFPVLVDEQGRVLDGHHRRAVDPQWPATRPLRFKSDEERLQIALIANDSAKWSVEDWRKLAPLRDAIGGQQSKRESIRQALAEHPEASHDRIAKDMGVSGHTVKAVCGSLQSADFSCTHGLTGQGARTDRKPTSDDRPRTDGSLEQKAAKAQQWALERLRDGSHVVQGNLQREFGLAQGTAWGALNAARAVYEAERKPQPEEVAPEPPAAPRAGAHRPHASRVGRSAPPLVTTLMTQVQKFLGLWAEDAPEPEPTAELQELEGLRRVIDERIAALRPPT